eukprot:m.166578 g.166578  ORF g.166578 m.166578 type:complete len:81 (+) comp13452_c0_seq2:509-751(+)
MYFMCSNSSSDGVQGYLFSQVDTFYSNNMDCSFTVVVPPQTAVTITVEILHLYNGANLFIGDEYIDFRCLHLFIYGAVVN